MMCKEDLDDPTSMHTTNLISESLHILIHSHLEEQVNGVDVFQ
jgi:hypothetical protein